MHLVAAKTILPIAAIVIALTTASPAFCQARPAAKRVLPVCNMDSFVYQAGAKAEMIYGDEGAGNNIPPLFGFTSASRISAGITGINDAGLTTGHGSYMPSGVGADEFIAAPDGEWAQSGANHGNLNYNNAAAALDAVDQASAADPAAAAQQASPLDQAIMNGLNNYNNSHPYSRAADADWP
jgi:hypothetical protein